MPKGSDVIEVDIDDLKAEIKAIEQSLDAAKDRLDESVRLANGAVERLEAKAAAASRRPSGATGGDLDERLEKARRNAARVEREGQESLARFRKQADASLDLLRRRLKLVMEKLASRH